MMDPQHAEEGYTLCEQALQVFAHYSHELLLPAIIVKTRYLVQILADNQLAYNFLIECAPFLQQSE